MPSLLCLLLLPAAVTAIRCHSLDPKYRTTARENWAELQEMEDKKQLSVVECAQEHDPDPLYACYTRVDFGELRMGCFNPKMKDIREICENSQWTGKSCDYEENTPMGAFHPKPGYGACCCTAHQCNGLPPSWLMSLTPEELQQPLRRDLSNVCFILATVTLFSLTAALAAVCQHFLEKWIKRLVPRKTAEGVYLSSEVERSGYGPVTLTVEPDDTPRSEQTTKKHLKTKSCGKKTPAANTQRSDPPLLPDVTPRTEGKSPFLASTPCSTPALDSTPTTTQHLLPEATQAASAANLRSPQGVEPTQTDE